MIFNFKNILLVLICCFCYSCTNTETKNATVIFNTDQEIQLNIKKPIDGKPNIWCVSEIIDLKTDHPVTCNINVDDFAYLRLDSEYPDIRQYLLLLEGSTTKVNYLDGKISIDGDNSQGQEYLHNNITKKTIGSELHNLIPIIGSNVFDEINIESLEAKLCNWSFNHRYKKDLKEMYDKKLINNKFYTVLSSTFTHHTNTIVFQGYMQLMQGRIKNYKPTREENAKIVECIGRLYSSPEILNKDSPKHLYYYPTDYYILKYHFLEEKKRNMLLEKYGNSTFGDYIGLMQAPDYVQLSQIGSIAIFEFKNGVGALYNEMFLNWFQETFPDKEHTAILTKLWEEKKEKETKEANAVFLKRETINSFKDFSSTKELQGKTLYIDMWASWCSPCLAQFKYNEKTHKLLENYNEIATVYISIDNDESDAVWKNQINFHKLDGYHLRATEIFLNYISNTLYNGNSVGVPRYILLGKDGSILNENLPRPSQTEELEKALAVAILKTL